VHLCVCVVVCVCMCKGRRSGEGAGRRWPRLPIDQQLLGFSCWAGRLGRRQQLGWGEGKKLRARGWDPGVGVEVGAEGSELTGRDLEKGFGAGGPGLR